MPNLIFLVDNYKNFDAIRNVTNYIVKSSYLDIYGHVGCYLVPGYEIAELVYNAFTAVKKAVGKEDGQLLQHIVVGFGDLPDIWMYHVNIVAHAIACYFAGQGYQVFWGSHYGSDNHESYPHIHFVVNTINSVTGNRFFVTYDTMNGLKQFLQKNCPDIQWSYESKCSYYIDHTA